MLKQNYQGSLSDKKIDEMYKKTDYVTCTSI